MQGSARKDVVFGAVRVYTVTVPGPKRKSWFNGAPVLRARKSVQICTSKVLEVPCLIGPRKLVVSDPIGNGPQNLVIKTHVRYERTIGNLGTPSPPPWRHGKLKCPWFSCCCPTTTDLTDATCWSLPLACVGVVRILHMSSSGRDASWLGPRVCHGVSQIIRAPRMAGDQSSSSSASIACSLG